MPGEVAVAGVLLAVGNPPPLAVAPVAARVAGGAITGLVDVTAGPKVRVGVGAPVPAIGPPNSLQPRSGAEPVKPVSGLAGTSSPLTVVYCATPRSIAGEPGWSTSPLKSSSTVPHDPSGPGDGADTKSGSCPVMLPSPMDDWSVSMPFCQSRV